ncbi:MAG: hypothetical protein Q8R37_01815 [Nanoarchaeota archaeon]|nr:hypothetical protein [Nanoarchaeota archaeon]
MLMDYNPLSLATDANLVDGALHLYEDGVFHDRVKIALQQGINLCEAIEEYNDEPEHYFTTGELDLRHFLDILCKNHPKVKKSFEKTTEIRNYLEELIHCEEPLTPKQRQEVHDYFSLIGIIITYGGFRFH